MKKILSAAAALFTVLASQPGAMAEPSGNTQGLSASRSYILKTTYLTADGAARYRDVTYYNGLGYEEQTIAVGASPNGGSIVTPVEYDSMRRPDAKAYLPYVRTDGSATYDGEAVSHQASWYRNAFSDSSPFSETVYETSPLGRPLSHLREGDDWRNGGNSSPHRSVTGYSLNTVSDHVWRFRHNPAAGTADYEGYYPECSLSCTSSQDEDGRQTLVFADAKGRTILIRQAGGQTADTYFIRDIRDSLVCVIQPEGVRALSQRAVKTLPIAHLLENAGGAPAAPNADIINEWCFAYSYDDWGNVIREHVPGAGTTIRTYDGRDRLASERTPQMAILGCTLRHHYDRFDRPVKEVLVRTDGGGNPFPASRPDSIVLVSRTYYPFRSESGYPTGSGNCGGLLRNETVWEVPSTTSFPSQASLQHVTRTYTYDAFGRVTRLLEELSDGWSSEILTEYDFRGNMVSLTETQRRPSDDTGHTLATLYTYDHRGRPATCRRAIDGDSLAVITYRYDALGRPAGRDVEGGAVTEDVSLDIHGWRTGTAVSLGADAAADGRAAILFSQTLRYADPVKAGTAALYSGLISEAATSSFGSALRTVGYAYDAARRLAGTRLYVGNTGTESWTGIERDIRYDLNGNILSLGRALADGSEQGLAYTYVGNTLTAVSDTLTFEDYAYTFNSAGNLTSDSRKGLQITYNILNLPSLVTISGTGSVNGGTVTYRYLSDGTKLSAICSNGTGRLYRGSFVYGRQTAGSSWREESIAWAGGRILCGASAGADENGNGEMGEPMQNYTDALYATDHLGNTRAVIDISPEVMEGYGSLTPSDILLEQDDYLPFGLRAGTSSATASGFDNLWRYAGKEEQRFGTVAASGSATASVVDLGLLDFGARSYDPVTARWTTPDPLAAKFPSMSPYNYCGNDPVNRIDPDGRWDVTVHLFEDRAINGYGYAVITDNEGNEVFRFDVRAEGSNGHDRTKTNADTPLGTYDIPDENPWIDGGDRQSYGPNSRLNMVPESGEIIETGRDEIRIHGGRQETFDPKTNTWSPIEKPTLKKTHGCLRAYDEDMKNFKIITENLQQKNKNERPGKVYIIDDLKNENDK